MFWHCTVITCKTLSGTVKRKNLLAAVILYLSASSILVGQVIVRILSSWFDIELNKTTLHLSTHQLWLHRKRKSLLLEVVGVAIVWAYRSQQV